MFQIVIIIQYPTSITAKTRYILIDTIASENGKRQNNALFKLTYLLSYLKSRDAIKILKIPACGRNFLNPSPLFKKGLYQQKRRYFVPKNNL